MTHHAAPVAESERIAALDCLRGVAVLGILLMNMTSYALPGAAYFNPTALGTPSRTDWAAWLLTHVLADHKFITLFSMLFGAGILLFAEHAEKRDEPAGRLHYRRMFWLLLLGAAHAYLLWAGDILVPYALCGMLVFLLRRRAPRTQLIAGILLFAFATCLGLFFNWSIPHWPPEQVREVKTEFWSPPPEKIAEEIQTGRGDWLAQFPSRAGTAQFLETQYMLMNTLWYCSGLMLVGMALYKWGVITGQRSSVFYSRMMRLGFLAGVPLILYGVCRNMQAGWDFKYSFFAGPEFNNWGSAGVALGYMSAVMLASRAGRPAWLLARLQSTGRMAFTNYILQTVICTAIFGGHGLGLFGSVPRVWLLALVFAIWILQLTYSPLWLARFHYGPLEWAWRSLTYGMRQPFRRAPAM